MLDLNVFSLLAEDETAGKITSTIVNSAYRTFIDIMNIVLPAVIGILLALAIILGIKVGIAFAKAEDEEGKKKAKTQLINVLLGFLIAIVLTAVIMMIVNGSAVKNLFKIK